MSAAVIGGGGGIGAAVVEKLCVDHAVAVGYHHRADRAEAVVDAARAAGGHAVAVGADVRTADGVTRIIDAAAELGPVRTVVHCAGAWTFPRVTELTEESLEEDYRTNLHSALLTLAEAEADPVLALDTARSPATYSRDADALARYDVR